ncbi:hypothetical protein M758_5G072800 [Ceratodon purpureus]|uniref:Uncharacterized protein n=1 Tax=Ceratodon purpureus TaxID=3225 RepID=A0A8T0HYU1_CERPU|nr:hypothetical protein KC19_5G073400 [Ceratodon purpureus]KAG0615879.1 hypothetical protein M758_5G072800 [Ceratodon purpureus]
MYRPIQPTYAAMYNSTTTLQDITIFFKRSLAPTHWAMSSSCSSSKHNHCNDRCSCQDQNIAICTSLPAGSTARNYMGHIQTSAPFSLINETFIQCMICRSIASSELEAIQDCYIHLTTSAITWFRKHVLSR